MTIYNALKNITHISDDSSLNLKNYMRSLTYISNLYKFKYLMEDYINFENVEFLPSFKDCYISEQLGISTITEENELRYLVLKSKDFLEDSKLKMALNGLKGISTKYEINGDQITIYLVNLKYN